jgi:ferredoxin-type protein NapG
MMTEHDAPPKVTPTPPANSKTRRMVMRSIAMGGAVVGASLFGFFPVLRKWTPRLRPPGAIDEADFLAACIKCGQCVQVCPVKAIELGDLDEGFGVGVPFVPARAQACDFSCDAVQCVLACPTGALSHKISKKEEVRMGLARLDRPNTCLARKGEGFKGVARPAPFKGVHRYPEIDRWKPVKLAEYKYDLALCDLCVRECPVQGAISLEPMSADPADKRRTPVVHQPCVGCGMCEMICPTEPASIVIDIRRKWGDA